MMKLRIALLVAACVSTAFAEKSEGPVYRDAATHEQLAFKLRKAQQLDPMLNREAVEGKDPSKENLPVDLLEQSDVINFRGYATLVPKRAILAVPEAYQRFLKTEPGVKIVGWQEFYRMNRGWITTVEVSRVEAEGNQALPEKTLEHIEKSRNLVVATCLGGPISVLPLKETAETNDKTDDPS